MKKLWKVTYKDRHNAEPKEMFFDNRRTALAWRDMYLCYNTMTYAGCFKDSKANYLLDYTEALIDYLVRR